MPHAIIVSDKFDHKTYKLCLNCRYMEDTPSCLNKYFLRWNLIEHILTIAILLQTSLTLNNSFSWKNGLEMFHGFLIKYAIETNNGTWLIRKGTMVWNWDGALENAEKNKLYFFMSKHKFNLEEILLRAKKYWNKYTF